MNAMGDINTGAKKSGCNLMEVYGSPAVVCQKFAERFAGRDPPSRLTIHRVYAKFVNMNNMLT